MTMPLHEVLKLKEQVHVRVDELAQDRYFPEFLHDFIGEIWDIDEEHIYLIGTNRDINGKSYISGPHRYCWGDITLEKI